MRRAVGGGPFLPSRTAGSSSIAASNRGARFCSASQGSIPCTNLAISEGLCENHLKRATSNVPLRPLTGQSRDVAGGSNSPGSSASSLGLSINGSSNAPLSSSSAAGGKDGKFSIVGSSVSRRVDDQKQQNSGSNDGSARTAASSNTTTTRAAGRTKRRTLHGTQQLPPAGGSPVSSSSSSVVSSSQAGVRSSSPSFGVSQSQPSLHGSSSSSVTTSSASGGLTLGGGPNSVAVPSSSSSSSGGHSPKMGHVGRRGINGSPNQYGATATSAIGRNAAAGNSTTGKPGRWAAEAAARSLPPLAATSTTAAMVPNNSVVHAGNNNNTSVLTTSSSSGSLSRPGSRPTTAGHGHTTINGAPPASSAISVAITPITSNSATNSPSLSLPLSNIGGSAVSSGAMAGAVPIASLQAPNNNSNNNGATSSLASMVSSSSSDEEHNGPHSTLARLLVSTDHRAAVNAPLLSSPSHSNQSESTSSSPSNGTRLRDQSNDGATTGRSVTIAGANTARRKRRQTRDRQSAHKSGSIEGPLPAPIGTVGISDFLYLAELMATCTSPDAFFPRVVEACHHLVHAEMTNIFMVQTAAGKSELICVAYNTFPSSPSASREQKSLLNVKLPLDSGLAGHVYSTGRAMCLRDAHKDWRFHENDTSLRGVMVQSVLVVPVRGDEGKVVGVIECINADQALGFTTNDDSNIKALAGCLSTMLRKTDLDREVNMRRKQTEALHHISAIISAELGVRRVIDRIVQACRLVVSAQCIRVWVLDDITRELVLSAQVAPGNERGAGNTINSDSHNNGNGNNADVKWTWNEDNPERIKFTEGILGNVALTGGTANVVDVTKDWRYESEKKRDRRQGPQVKAMLATAVKDYLAGRTIAVLECINKPLRDTVQSFTADDETLLSSIASTAASVLRQAQLYEEAVRIRKQTEALKNIIELMSADIGTGMLVTRIIDASYKLVDAERITLFTVEDMEDDENKDAKEAPKAKRGADVHKRDKSVVASALLREEPPTKTLVCIVSKDENMRGMRVPWGAGIVGHVGLTLKSLNIPNAYEDSRFDKEADKRTGFHTKSILTVPVVDQLGAGVAVIQAVNKRSAGGAFLADDVRALESLAASAGIILQKSKMYHATVCAERKNRALVQLLKVVTQEESALSTIIDGITRVTYDVLDADRISIYFVDTRRAELFSIVSQETQGVRFKFGTGIAGYVADKGIPVNCKNVYLDPRFDSTFDEKTGYRTKSMLCMPVKDSDGNVLAVVQALNKARVHVTSRMTISMSMTINMDQQQHSPTSPVLIGGKSSSSSGGPSSGNFATGRQSMSARDGLSVPNRASSAIGALGSPTTGSGQAFTHFTDDDMNILSAICEQIRDSIRKCRIEAIAEHAGAADDKVSSLLDLYSDQTRKRGGNGNGTPRAGGAAGAAPSEYGYPKTPSSGAAKASAGVFASMTGPQESTVVMQRTSYVWPVMTSLASGASSEQLAALCDRKFNVFDYSEDQLLGFSYVIFHQTGFLDTYIDGGRLKQFLLSVRKKYRNNPFHNWYHGFSALQFTYYLLKTCAAHSTLITHDVLGLLIGALCHDIDHPGFTNQFEIMSSSDLARVHNDQSVLENHHAYTLFHILRQKECNVFEKFSQSTQRELRRCLIGGILATDMVHHSEATKKLSGVTDMKAFDYTVEADRQQVVNMIIHTADLSAQAYPRLVAKSWEERIVREFQNEVTHEERLGIPVAKFMQGLDDPRLRAGLQVNFILYVLIPWWSNVARLMPELQPMLDELRANREYYDGISAGTIAPPRDTLDAHAPLPTIPHPSNPMVTFRPGSAGGGMNHHTTTSGSGGGASHGMPSLHLSSLSVNTGDISASSPRPVWPDGASGDSPAAANDTHMAIRVTASDGTAAVPTSSAHPSRTIR